MPKSIFLVKYIILLTKLGVIYMPETQQTPDIAEKMKMLDFEQTKAKANLEAAKGTVAYTENGASATTQEDEKSGYVTVNENGGVLVFGEPLGVDSVDLGVGSEKILVEIDKDEDFAMNCQIIFSSN
jgi:hypothetical protein